MSRHTIILPGSINNKQIEFDAESLKSKEGHKLVINPFTYKDCKKLNSSDSSKKRHLEIVRKAIKTINTSDLRKVVIARQLTIPTSNHLDVELLFEILSKTHPQAYCFLLNTKDYGTWIGASPEMLLKKRGNYYQTSSLAGTLPLRTIDSWTSKEHEEQQYVTQGLVEGLKQIGVTNFKIGKKRVVASGKMLHIKSNIDFEYGGHYSSVLSAIHPSAAVSGYPKNAALDFINNHEPFNRSLYAGYVCVEKANGDVDAFVILRCAKIVRGGMVLFAGGGITAESLPLNEWNETELKMSTMLTSINNAISATNSKGDLSGRLQII